jgi:hypothetical protein
VLIDPSQLRTPAGWRSAAASTARGEPGLCHNVATETSTYAVAGSAGRAGGAGAADTLGAVAEAVGLLAVDLLAVDLLAVDPVAVGVPAAWVGATVDLGDAVAAVVTPAVAVPAIPIAGATSGVFESATTDDPVAAPPTVDVLPAAAGDDVEQPASKVSSAYDETSAHTLAPADRRPAICPLWSSGVAGDSQTAKPPCVARR